MRTFNYISLEYFKDEELLIWKIKDTGMPNFCLKRLQEFQEFSLWVKDYFSNPERPLKFIVSGSEYQGVYNMGGDLPYFLNCIKTNQKEKLKTYAHLCIEAVYNMYSSFGLPVITMALIEGNAYGGGFECALAHDFILANDEAKFCLPESKFNLFPGMGAHSLLTRKMNVTEADVLIRSGKTYTSRYLESLGLVEKVMEKNKSMILLNRFIKELKEQFIFEYHHIQCKKIVNPLSKQELLKITDLWVDACMKISQFDLRKMEILANAQARRSKVIPF